MIFAVLAAPVSPNAMYPIRVICANPTACESRGLCSRIVTAVTTSSLSSWILMLVKPLVDVGGQIGTMWVPSRLPSTVTAAGQAARRYRIQSVLPSYSEAN